MNRQMLAKLFPETYRQWPHMTRYGRFEQGVVLVLVLSFVISIVVVIALIELIGKVARMLIAGALDPLDHAVFQTVFGAIMTLLIAMEFKHSIVGVLERRESIIHVKTVMLIAIMALARKFIIIDPTAQPPAMLLALAGVILALGAVYWLMRDRDSRDAGRDADGGRPWPISQGAVGENSFPSAEPK